MFVFKLKVWLHEYAKINGHYRVCLTSLLIGNSVCVNIISQNINLRN